MPYKVYIDDSGTDGVLFKLDGTPCPNPQPYAVVGGILVPQVHEASMKNAWDDLRSTIASTLQLNELPPIHMRLMWGTSRPKNIRAGVPNPYLLATKEQIKGWVEDALSILDRFRRSRGLLHFGFGDTKARLASNYADYFAGDLWRREYAAIAAASTDVLEAFHNAAANPLPEMLAHSVFYLDQLVAQQTMRSACITYDRNPSAKGFGISAAMEAIKQRGILRTIRSLDVGDHMTDVLLQAADVVAYRMFRSGLEKVREQVDEVFSDWRQRFPMVGGGWEHTDRVHLEASVVRYDVARRAAREVDANVVDTLFVDVDEFRRRAREVMRAAQQGRGEGGVPVLR